MTERCGLTKSGDCLGGCNPRKPCSARPTRPLAEKKVIRYEGHVRTIEDARLPEEDSDA